MGPEDSLSDRELLERAADGSGAAFAALMRRHEDKVFACAMKMLGNRPDALDATQDAFIAAFRQAARFRGDAAVGTWLYRIAINASYDMLRKRKRWVDHDEDLPESDTRAPIDDQVAARVSIERALAQISPEYREAVVMHDVGALPYDEIAAITGVPVGTVKSRISRGRRALADLLEQRDSPEASKGHR